MDGEGDRKRGNRNLACKQNHSCKKKGLIKKIAKKAKKI